MKILCIDDDFFKRNQIGQFLEEKGIITEEFEFINPALQYILEHKNDISGIVLDLGLKTSKDSNDYDPHKGLEIISELEQKKIGIPILINSISFIEIADHPYLFGYRKAKNDYKILEDFVSFLRRREKQ